MEKAKKLIPFVIIAIIFSIGGYFIGRGVARNQEALLFNANQAAYRSWHCQQPANKNKPECKEASLAPQGTLDTKVFTPDVIVPESAGTKKGSSTN